MNKESAGPVRILTDGELTTLEIINNNGHVGYEGVSALIESHRSLLSANAELSFENMIRKKYEGFLMSVIRCKATLEETENFESFKKRMEETK